MTKHWHFILAGFVAVLGGSLVASIVKNYLGFSM